MTQKTTEAQEKKVKAPDGLVSGIIKAAKEDAAQHIQEILAAPQEEWGKMLRTWYNEL